MTDVVLGIDIGTSGVRIAATDENNALKAMAAAPIGKPGWPLLAFCTASAERKRMVLIHLFSNSLLMIASFSGGSLRLICVISVMVQQKFYHAGYIHPRGNKH